MPLRSFHRHPGEVAVVDRLVGGERVVPDAVQAAFRIDVPERIGRELVQACRLTARIDRPDVEPAGVLDRPFGVLDDQRLVARQIGDRSLSEGAGARQAGDGSDRNAAQDTHRLLLVRAVAKAARLGAEATRSYISGQPGAMLPVFQIPLPNPSCPPLFQNPPPVPLFPKSSRPPFSTPLRPPFLQIPLVPFFQRGKPFEGRRRA